MGRLNRCESPVPATIAARFAACISASAAAVRTRRDEAIRHRGPHQRRIVASVRMSKAVSPSAPRG